MIEHPHVNGPPDPPPTHCGRTRADAMPDHLASGCTRRAYAPDVVDELAQRGVTIDDEDQHDDCTLDICTSDGDCLCTCRDCTHAKIDEVWDFLVDELGLDELVERSR